MWLRGRHRRVLDDLAAEAARRAEAAERARAEVERRTGRSLMVASTSERLAEANRIAAMIRDGLLDGRARRPGTNGNGGG